MACFQSRMGMVHFFAIWCRARYSTFITDSSVGNERRVLVTFRSEALRDSMSFSEDDCTRQRGLKAVVQSSIERTVSGVRCTNDDLKPVLVALATDQPLDVRYRDHDLSGDWAGYRECYIKPDLLLIYRKSDADTLRLARLGSHSELFG